MKNCENCRYSPRSHGCISGITCIDFSQYKPDYATLEQENAELKQKLEALTEKSCQALEQENIKLVQINSTLDRLIEKAKDMVNQGGAK